MIKQYGASYFFIHILYFILGHRQPGAVDLRQNAVSQRDHEADVENVDNNHLDNPGGHGVGPKHGLPGGAAQ